MYFCQHISSMHFIQILLFCLLLPTNVLLGAMPPDTVEVDTLSVDKKALCAAAFDCLNCNRLNRARNYARQLLRLAERTDDRSYGQIYGHLILGLAGIESASSTEVYMHLETARALAERYHDHEALMRVLNGFGNYSMFVNDDVYSAISYYFQALDEAKHVDDRRLYAMILSNISGGYFMREDPSGLKYAEEAVRIAQEIKEPIPLFYATFNSAFYYLAAGDLPHARIAIEAIEQMHAAQGFGMKADIFLLKAQYYEKLGETGKAYEYYARAMESFSGASASTITMIYLKYAALLRADHHADAATRVLEYALRHIEESGVPMGAYVTEIRMDSPAMRAGIQSGDVITKLGTEEITTFSDYQDAVLDLSPNPEVTVTLMRQGHPDYQEMTLEVLPEG